MQFNREQLEEELLKDYDYQHSSAMSLLNWFQPRILALFLFLCFIAFVGYAWYSDKFTISQSDEAPPLVRASEVPVRVKPKDPGGMQFSNKDKAIYRAIVPGEGLPTVTRILSEPEKPIARELILAPKNELKDAVREQVAEEEVIELQEDALQEEAPAQTDELVVPEDDPIKAIVARNMTVVAPTPLRRRKVAGPIKAKTDDYKIQLGAYRSEQDVQLYWSIFQEKHQDVLGEMTLLKEKANLAEKGTFYRLQAGGFASKNDARRACQQLIERKQGCFVVQ